jgi:hypothetical protein
VCVNSAPRVRIPLSPPETPVNSTGVLTKSPEKAGDFVVIG